MVYFLVNQRFRWQGLWDHGRGKVYLRECIPRKLEEVSLVAIPSSDIPPDWLETQPTSSKTPDNLNWSLDY